MVSMIDDDSLVRRGSVSLVSRRVAEEGKSVRGDVADATDAVADASASAMVRL